MQTETLLIRYQQILDQYGFQFDDVQYQIVLRLEEIRLALIQRQVIRPAGTDISHFFLRCIRRRNRHLSPVPGLYLWGDVGRGKLV